MADSPSSDQPFRSTLTPNTTIIATTTPQAGAKPTRSPPTGTALSDEFCNAKVSSCSISSTMAQLFISQAEKRRETTEQPTPTVSTLSSSYSGTNSRYSGFTYSPSSTELYSFKGAAMHPSPTRLMHRNVQTVQRTAMCQVHCLAMAPFRNTTATTQARLQISVVDRIYGEWSHFCKQQPVRSTLCLLAIYNNNNAYVHQSQWPLCPQL